MKTLSLLLAILCGSTQAQAYFSVSPGYVNFGNVSVGTSSYVSSIFVINHSSEPEYLNVYGYCADFIVNDYCFTLPQHGTCSITAQFVPQSEGTKYCTVNISSRNGFGSATLSGTATRR
jgi:hypothetical protein